MYLSSETYCISSSCGPAARTNPLLYASSSTDLTSHTKHNHDIFSTTQMYNYVFRKSVYHPQCRQSSPLTRPTCTALLLRRHVGVSHAEGLALLLLGYLLAALRHPLLQLLLRNLQQTVLRRLTWLHLQQLHLDVILCGVTAWWMEKIVGLICAHHGRVSLETMYWHIPGSM